MTARRSSLRPGRSSRSALPASRQRCISQRRPSGVIVPSLMPLAAQHLRHRADRARRAERLAPVARRERPQRLLELGAGGDLRLAERALGETAVGEVLHRQADAADLERLGPARPRRRGRGSSRSSGRRCRRPAAARSTAAGGRRRRRSGALPRGRRSPRSAGRGWSGRAAGTRRGSCASRSVCVATARTWLGPKPSSRLREPGEALEAARRRLVARGCRRRRARRRGARFPSGSRCADSGRRRSWPISRRKLFEPMSIAASWPGQRVRCRGSEGRFQIHRADCAVRMRRRGRSGFLECSPSNRPRCAACTPGLDRSPHDPRLDRLATLAGGVLSVLSPRR